MLEYGPRGVSWSLNQRGKLSARSGLCCGNVLFGAPRKNRACCRGGEVVMMSFQEGHTACASKRSRTGSWRRM